MINPAHRQGPADFTHIQKKHAKFWGTEGQIHHGRRDENAPVREHSALVVLVQLFANLDHLFSLQKPEDLRVWARWVVRALATCSRSFSRDLWCNAPFKNRCYAWIKVANINLRKLKKEWNSKRCGRTPCWRTTPNPPRHRPFCLFLGGAATSYVTKAGGALWYPNEITRRDAYNLALPSSEDNSAAG